MESKLHWRQSSYNDPLGLLHERVGELVQIILLRVVALFVLDHGEEDDVVPWIHA
jgi:hypothetical protein